MAVETQSRHMDRPADYYSSPAPERVLPPGVSYGCGGAALLVLILVFAGGAFLARGGFTQVMDLVFGMTMGEMRGMYAPDVTAAQKKSLESEIETMRGNLRGERVSVQSLEPVLNAIRRATSDKKLDGREVEWIVAVTRKVNAAVKKTHVQL